MTSRMEADPIFCPLIRRQFGWFAIVLEQKNRRGRALNES